MTLKAKRSDSEVLFGDSPETYLSLDDNMNRLADREGLSAKEITAERKSFSQMALNDIGFDRPDAQRLHDLVTEARLNRGNEEWLQKAQKWPEESRKRFREKYAANADQVNRDVDAFIQQQPALGKLVAGELAGHPDVR